MCSDKNIMVEANSSLSPVKQAISDFIDERKASVFEISRCIHERPEMAFEEFFASELLTDFLAKEGFSLQKGVVGLGTSFVAKYR